jgi:hypothetical protein
MLKIAFSFWIFMAYAYKTKWYKAKYEILKNVS